MLNQHTTAPTRIILAGFILVILLLVLAAGTQPTVSAQDQPIIGVPETPKWTVTLPHENCYGSNDPNCFHGSPTLADVNEDGYDDVIVSTNNGHLVVVKHNGQVLWDVDVAPYFGMASNQEEINSSPAVADIDNDGDVEIVVGVGTIHRAICTQGGVIVLDRWGHVEPGWPQSTTDWVIPPAGCNDSIFSSPALGDLDNDGDLEIVVGGFDMRIYAWHHNGQFVDGFPPNSYLYDEFPWSIFVTHLADVVWSSPALADINHDGYLDIITGTDEGNQGSSWNCPYALPAGWRSGYCGGSIYALDRHGQFLPGFPRHFLETVQSSPVVADINSDGEMEIIVGSGTFYRNNSPDHPTYGFRIHVMDSQARDLPGWEGGKAVGGPVPASPAIGDITGDGAPEIIVATAEERLLYAWDIHGQLISGFPSRARDMFGQTTANYDTGQSFVLADFDGDSKMEIILNLGWTVVVIDGDGRHLTSTYYPNSDRPVYLTDGTLSNTPAVGDIDHDGKLELITHNSILYVWDLPNASDKAEWPMFKFNAAGTASPITPASLDSSHDALLLFHQTGVPGPIRATIQVQNMGGQPMNWTITPPAGITTSPSSGTLDNGSATVQVTIATTSLRPGFNSLGTIRVRAYSNGVELPTSPINIPVTVYYGNVNHIFLSNISQ
ncbi:MAG: VCBS repeat-containing protein [Pseudomonadales bacterium]|nr:VCBS repeat-containing protein [Anaerolineales bacterium]MCB8918589.1 VCBS repeat-containing protein [Ardenticatenaceae bacterium]MCB8919933.1 VCBS repeat-containing protein [Ardenticatenaceae bacterium]MCP5190575.1 VCBS repeat-containing protein [Pseudomonadales bacterium]